MPPDGSIPGRAATCTMAPEPCCRMCGATAWLSHLAADTAGEVTQPTLTPVDRHHREADGGEGHRRRVTKRTACTGHDRHLCAHGVTRPGSAAVTCSPSRSTLLRIMNSSFSSHRRSEAVVQCHVVLLDHAIDGPRVARGR